MNKIFLSFIIVLGSLISIITILAELNYIDFLMYSIISLVFLSPFIVYGSYKLIKKITIGEKIVSRLDESELMHRFAEYLWNVYNFDIYTPNRIFGNKGKKSHYKYPIKINRCYPAEIEKLCIEIPDTIRDSHVFNGLETHVLLYFNSNGKIDNDRIMNDDYGVDWDLLSEPLNFYMRGPSKTEKAENILEKIFKEKGEIPEELIEKAIGEKLTKV